MKEHRVRDDRDPSGPNPSWVGRRLEAAYRSGRLAVEFDRPAPAGGRRRWKEAAREGARPEEDDWHH